MSKKTVAIVSVFVLVIALLCLKSCGNSGSDNAIVGRWVSHEESRVFYSEIEFFSDGTYITETASWSGTYSIDRNRIKLSGKLYGEVFSFEVSKNGEKLTLTNNNGYSISYNRF